MSVVRVPPPEESLTTRSANGVPSAKVPAPAGIAMVNVRAVHAVLLNERMLLSAPTCTQFLSSCTNTLRVELLPLRRVTNVTPRFEPYISTMSLATATLRGTHILVTDGTERGGMG